MRGSGWGILHQWALGKLNSMGQVEFGKKFPGLLWRDCMNAQAHLSFPAPINLISTKSLWTDLYIVFRSPKKLSISSSDDDLEACKYLFDIRYMLKNFEHFSLSVVNKMLVFRAEIHKNACQNSKQRRPWSEAVWSGSALFVLQGFS